MKHGLIILSTITTIILAGCAAKEVPDEAVGAYTFRAVAESVHEGDDIPVHLSFSDAGLVVDNASWGDKWEGATFFATITDVLGRAVDNAVYSGPGGVLANGSKLNIGPSRKMDLVIGSLREGSYLLKINLRTRYTVDTWATAHIVVKERISHDDTGGVLVDDFTVPGADNGLEIDDIGNIILDLKYFNASNPFVFNSVVRPENAANKQLNAESANSSVATISVDRKTTLVIVPKVVGTTRMTVRSADGNAEKSFGVTVIESAPDMDGFTLPTDDSERENYDFDVAGRLALDINVWNDENPFRYVCRPIPSTAPAPTLTAVSDTPSVVVASIENGNRLVLKPQQPGYAIVTVSTTDGTVVRRMRVAVISKFTLVVDAVEEAQSEEDKKTGIFPCRLTFKTSTKWYPVRMKASVYAKATGRVDLTNDADYFKVDSLKNSRTAYYSVEDQISVLYLSNGNSSYQLYNRVMSKMASMGVVVHHSDDWPNYYDYVMYFKLYKIVLNVAMVEEYDTNLYRVTIDRQYDSIEHRLYQYL